MTPDPLINALPKAFLRRLRARAYAEDCRALIAALTPAQRARLVARCKGLTWAATAALSGVHKDVARLAVCRAIELLGVGSLPEAAVMVEKAGLL